MGAGVGVGAVVAAAEGEGKGGDGLWEVGGEGGEEAGEGWVCRCWGCPVEEPAAEEARRVEEVEDESGWVQGSLSEG